MKKLLVFVFVMAITLSVYTPISVFADSSEDSDFIPTIGAVDESPDGATTEEEAETEDTDATASGESIEASTEASEESLTRSERMSTALEHMGVGLLGVMLVLVLIACVVFILNKIFKPQ